MDIASFIISIVALLASIVAIYNDKRIAENDIRASNCSLIFDNYLIEKIPQARAKIQFDSSNGHLKNCNELCDVIESMLFSALFYKYDDSHFYLQLKQNCQTLVDLLLLECDKPHLEKEDQDSVIRQIQSNMEIIYHLIDQKRVGATLPL